MNTNRVKVKPQSERNGQPIMTMNGRSKIMAFGNWANRLARRQAKEIFELLVAPTVNHKWQKHAFPAFGFILFTSVWAGISYYHSSGGGSEEHRNHFHIVYGLYLSAVWIYDRTRSDAVAFAFVITISAISAYFTRLLFRPIYSVVEMIIGMNIAMMALPKLFNQIASRTAPDYVTYSQATVFAGGIYIIIRGMVNLSDSIKVVPKKSGY